MAYSKNRRLAEIISDTSGNLSVQGIVVPTQSNSDNDTSAASTAFVHNHIDALVDSAPGTMNTLNEIAAALNDDAAFNTTVTNAIATKAPLASPSLTGSVTISATGTNASPHIKLAESGDIREFNIFNDGSGNGRLVLADSDDDTPDAEIVLADNGVIQFKTANTNRVTIAATGRMAIGNNEGTSANNLTLHDSSSAELDLDCSGGKNFRWQSTNASTLQLIDKDASNAVRFAVASGGDIGIGIDSGMDGKVHILQGSAGSVTASTDKNTLVVENSTHGGITTLTPDASESGIFFGHASGARTGEIYTKYGDDLMTIGSRKSGMAVRFFAGNATEVLRLRGDGAGINFPDNHTFIGTTSSAGGTAYEWGSIRRPASADGGQLSIRQYSSGSTAPAYPAYAGGSGGWDENTGMYFPSADTVGLSGNGQPRIEIGPHSDTDKAAVKVNNQSVHKAGALTIYGGSSTASNGGYMYWGGHGRYYEHVVQNHTTTGANRYWHIETNIATNLNIMFYAHYEGYAYGNSGNYAAAVRTGYMYSPNAAVINTVHKQMGSTGDLGIYNSSNNRLVFRCDFGGGYYSGGKFSIGFPAPAGYSHDFQVVAHTMNSTSGSHY